MWWVIPIAVVAVTLIALVIVRRVAADRRRLSSWDDLRERGKMMTAQLAHLREVQEQREGRKS